MHQTHRALQCHASALDAQHLATHATQLRPPGLAAHTARINRDVNAVCPAVIETDMFRRAAVQDPRKAEFAAALHPIGRLGQAEEIAAAVLYLCSDQAGFTTGHSLVVDGGATVV